MIVFIVYTFKVMLGVSGRGEQISTLEVLYLCSIPIFQLFDKVNDFNFKTVQIMLCNGQN